MARSALIVFKVYIVSITNRVYAYPQSRFVYTGKLDRKRYTGSGNEAQTSEK